MKTFFQLCLLLLLTNVQAKNKLQPITLQQTIELSQVSSVRVSPDGKHLAYTKTVPRKNYQDADGEPFIDLLVKSGADKSRVFITGHQRVGGISWGPKSHYIYFLAQRGDDQYVAIYRIAVDGGESQKLFKTDFDISAFTINSQGTSVTYLAEDKKDEQKEKLEKLGFKAKVYEESKKNTHAYIASIADPNKPHVQLSIDQHVVSVQYHPTNNNLLVKVAPTALVDDKYVASEFQIMKQSGKFLKRFKTEGKLGSASWSPNGQYVAMIGSANKNDPASGRLFVANAKSGKIKKFLSDYPGHLKGFQWISDYQLVLLSHRDTKSEISVLNVDSQNITIKHKAGNQVLTAIHADNSGKRIIGIGSSDSHPKEIFDLSNGGMERVTETNSLLQNIEMPKQETISYTARDGIELQGVLIYPSDYRKSKRYPLIMMIHGGPESHISDGWLDRYTYPIKYASANGFAVFLPNYRGSTARGVEFSKMGQADYAGKEFNDLVDAITHLSKIGLVDKKRVGITGASYGGYASAWAATALSEHFAASVMFVGISDQISKFGTTDIPKEMHDVHARYYPWEKWQWMLERSPIYHTDKAKTPILIMHGDSDPRVHPSQSMELYRYIKTRTDTPVRLVFYPDEGHGNKHTAARLDYSIRLMRWMEFYLKGRNKGKKMPAYEIDHASHLKGG